MYNRKITAPAPKNQEAIFVEPHTRHLGDLSATADSPLGGEGLTLISCPFQLVNSGCDTLHATIKAFLPGPLLIALDSMKKEIQTGIEQEANFKFGQSSLFSFNLSRTGSKLYQYILRSGDICLGFSTRKPDSTIPNMMLCIGSISCQDNLQELLGSLRMWLKHNGIITIEEKVSRIDLCADLANHIGQLDLMNFDKYITRASKVRPFYEHYKLTGIMIGAGTIGLRIYDKILEISDKRQDHKGEFFQEKWGNVSELTRVEFQLRREVIKDMFPRNSSIETVLKFQAKIWEYLTTKWFRQAASEVDRKNRNQGQAKNSDFWDCVTSAFSVERVTPIGRKRKQKHINTKALIAQALGCLLSVCAGVGHDIEDKIGMQETIHLAISDKYLEYSQTTEFLRTYPKRVAGAVVSF